MPQAITTVVFDLGGVLVDWDPRYLYRKLLNNDEKAVDKFLSEVCTPGWNYAFDCGDSFADGEAKLIAKFPDKADLIRAWRLRFDETLKGPIEGTVAILTELKDRGIPLYALTNWAAETFPVGRKRFKFFEWFKGIVVSGDEKVAKPDPRIFQILIDRYKLNPRETVFIDDRPENVEAAIGFGFNGIHFVSPADLRDCLVAFGLLESAASPVLENA